MILWFIYLGLTCIIFFFASFFNRKSDTQSPAPAIPVDEWEKFMASQLQPQRKGTPTCKSSVLPRNCWSAIHSAVQKQSVQPFCFWEHSKGLSKWWMQYLWKIWLVNDKKKSGLVNDKYNICSRYCIYHVKFTSYRVFSRDVIKFLNPKLKSHRCFYPH